MRSYFLYVELFLYICPMKYEPLTPQLKQALEKQHKSERDGRVRDRIKAILFYNQGHSYREIARWLLVDDETIRRYVKDYFTHNKLKPSNGGSCSKLNEEQEKALVEHLREHLYLRVKDICAYVKKTYEVVYSTQGMRCWLHAHGFSYKHPKGVPAKADGEKQAAFVATYEKLKENTPKEEPILFIDSVHPTMGTKLGYGWIRRGEEKSIRPTASRTRLNILGAIRLSTMEIEQRAYQRIDGERVKEFLQLLRSKYPKAPLIHVILDQAGYHKSASVQCLAKKQGIKLPYLPPYSPNLNPIERLWKVLNEPARKNRYFSSAQEFGEQIAEFFQLTLAELIPKLRTRINDNFQIINFAT